MARELNADANGIGITYVGKCQVFRVFFRSLSCPKRYGVSCGADYGDVRDACVFVHG